jgi:hypothetical protein
MGESRGDAGEGHACCELALFVSGDGAWHRLLTELERRVDTAVGSHAKKAT